MMASATQPKPTATREVTLTRVFDAPRAMVWNAWIDPKQMAQWWGPHHFTNPRCELDVRPGGAIRIDMRAPNGTVYPMGGHFDEIVPRERLVFTAIAEDHDGNALLESVTTVTFVEEGGEASGRLPSGPRHDPPGVDGDDLTAVADLGEGRRIGPGHPDLGAERGQFGEQCGAAAGVEIRYHLVEQQQRRDAGHLGDQIGVGQHQADQERLLLAG